jgi:transposase
VWAPGETLIIDWGERGGWHVFCAVLAWSRLRFVRFAGDEKAATTLGLLAECVEVLGGVPKTVLADRMGCLTAGVVANVVVPTADYVRFATHYMLTELREAFSQVKPGVSLATPAPGRC